jgi:inhibitor of cysteine peptidase
MKKRQVFLVMLTLLALVVSACQTLPPTEGPDAGDGGTDDEVGYTYGEDATVESLDILILESFPVQVMADVTGYLPDGCTELDEIRVDRTDQTFTLTLVTRRSTGDVACTEALVPFEESAELDVYGLDAGTYTVVAQDRQAEFTLSQDNILPEEQKAPSEGPGATVEGMFVHVEEDDPICVEVVINGYLPDGCTTLEEILVEREGQTFTLEVITQRAEGDVACTQAIVPFEEIVTLDVTGLPAGAYAVNLRGYTDSFNLEEPSKAPETDSGCPVPQEEESLVEYANRSLGLGFCFVIPEGFQRLAGADQDGLIVVGPEYDGDADPPNRASLTIEMAPLGEMDLSEYVAAQNAELAPEAALVQEVVSLDGDPAILVTGYPVQVDAKVLWAAHGGQVVKLIFSPMRPETQPQATDDMEYLFQKVQRTWTFLGDD